MRRTNLIMTLLALCVLTAGAANLTVTVTPDDYPEETGWSFFSLDGDEELFRQDIIRWRDGNSSINNNGTSSGYNGTSSGNSTFTFYSSMTFYDLAPGSYLFTILDLGYNGLCCSNNGTNGMISFSNETHIYYEHDGIFADMLEIDVVVDGDGDISSIHQVGLQKEEQEAIGVDAEAVDPIPAAEDPEWPGVLAEFDDHSFTINIRFDDNPQDAVIKIWEKDDTYFNKGWHDFFSYTAVEADAYTLWSATFDDIEPGVYFLRITNPGTGWATLTNKTQKFWAFEGDHMIEKAQFTFLVKGFFGYTIPWSMRGNPPQ